jgi:bifunctional NMN adenylyltransferase/nudix hydrolase
MAKKYDLAVFIGRFQPVHNGHMQVIKLALKSATNVLVLIGSANEARSHRNPWTYQERKDMIRSSIHLNDVDRVEFMPLEDSAYNDTQWIKSVQDHVSHALKFNGIDETHAAVALVGHSKDQSSYYLKMFPVWDSIEAPNYNSVNSTDIRNWYFSDTVDSSTAKERSYITSDTLDFLVDWKPEPEYKKILEEYEFVEKYKKSWAAAPYAPTFVTVDAVVVQSGHIALVRRRAAPGKGLWALPGGFLNPQERIRDAVIRELREETGIKVPDPVLRGSIVAQDVFDAPNRSSRGRTITHAFLFKLKDEPTLPRIKGMDDADKARWVPINQVKRSLMFEDHYAIIHNMLARI